MLLISCFAARFPQAINCRLHEARRHYRARMMVML